MAPKRAARKAAPPAPPPPPPAESSDETRSGSRSRSDDSEDEEAIAESPVPASTPALKNNPAPAQKGDESELSGDDDDDDEEEEEPVRAPPKNQPPPPQKKEDSETSGDEEQEEEPTRAARPSAPKKQPPPQPQKKEDSDASGDEGESEEEEEEAPPPPPKPAPKKEAEALKPPAAAGTKKPGAAQRMWSTDDEVRILEALAAHQKRHGTFPQPDALVDALAGKLDNPAYGSKELQTKVKNLRLRFHTLSSRGELPSKEHDRRLLDLCKLVWTGDKITVPGATSANNGHEPKGFEEMCELYPYLAEEVKGLQATHPGMCKREFGKMDDDKARTMDEKIKKQRVAQIKLEMRRADLAKEVTKALLDLLDG